MAPLPKGFSLAALPIQSALSEGRTEDAKRLICEILEAGKADSVVQQMAAKMIKPVKRRRGKPKADPKYWFEIGEEFHHLRDHGSKYEDALAALQSKWGYSETHVRNAIRLFDLAKQDHDESTAEYYD